MTVINFQKKVGAVIITTMIFAGGILGNSHAAYADVTINETATEEHATIIATSPASVDEQHIAFPEGIINSNNDMYIPMRAFFAAYGMTTTWQADGQPNKVKLSDATGDYQLIISGHEGKSYLSTAIDTTWYEHLLIDGQCYISLGLVQELLAGDVSLADGNAIVITDTNPDWVASGDIFINNNSPWNHLPTYTIEEPPAPATTFAAADSLIGTGKQFVGVPYVYGGRGPGGFDCSGFTSYVYGQHGISLPRTAAAQQSSVTPVALSDVQPGDLVFWGYPAHHVGIYIGDGKYVHASTSQRQIAIGDAKWYAYTSAGRY